MKYEKLLDDIKNKDIIQFYNYTYFPKDNQLWDKGRLYFVNFLEDRIEVVYGNDNVGSAMIMKKLSEVSGFEYIKNSSLEEYIDIIVISKEEQSSVYIHENLHDKLNDFTLRAINCEAKKFIVGIIDSLYGIDTYKDLHSISNTTNIETKNGEYISINFMRDKKGYFFRITAGLSVLNQLYNKINDESDYSVRKHFNLYTNYLELRV